MLNIYYGRENLDKGKFIFNNINGETIILVPDQYTLEAEREAFRHLGVRALMDVEILSASRLGSRILEQQGGGKKSFIDKYGRHILLHKIAQEQREGLKVFRGMEKKSSFVDSVNNFISEMKQYGCGPEDLNAMAQTIEEDSYTKRKLEDIHLLFSEYERQIDGKYTDSEDYIDLYINKISQSSWIKENEVWVYGFDSFAPKTMALIGRLMATAKSLNLVITYSTGTRDEDLFQLLAMVIANMENLADSMGICHNKREIPKEYHLGDRKPAMGHIERELYAIPYERSNDCRGITLVEAAGIYNEAESAASYVLELVRDKGLRYRDIKVICNDTDQRGQILTRVFQEYGIRLFSDSKRDIMASPIVETIVSLIGVVAEKYRSNMVLRFLKTGFMSMDEEELSELENYVIKYKIKGGLWKKPFRRGKNEYDEELLEKLEGLRQKAMEPLGRMEELFEEKTTAGFIEKFYGFLADEFKLPQKISSFMESQVEKGFVDLADETAQIWGSVVDILGQIHEIMGNEPFDGVRFLELLTVGLSQVEMGMLPPTEDGLIMGTMQRSRSGKVKAMIVVGANEGILPQEKSSQGIFSAEERELFKESGKELCKVDSIRSMEEKMAIYRNLSAATEYLWIGCSLSDEEGNQIKPSEIFTKIKEIFPSAEVEKDVLNRDDVRLLINSKTSGMVHLTNVLQTVGDEKTPNDQWGEALFWFEKNRPAQMEQIRSAFSFTNKQEELGKAAAEALFKRNTAEAMSLSPSRLERFSRCPFSHLVAYGLKPEERRIYETAPREIGDIYHQCLMRLTDKLTTEGVEITSPESLWMQVTKTECDNIVEKEMKSISAEYREGLLTSGEVEAYRGSRVEEICKQVCWTVVEQVRAGRIKNILPEVSFGRKGNIPPIEIDLEDQTVFIEGIIDRVDVVTDDRIKIIDYKTGNESFDSEEAAAGYRMQLMLYLQAACQNEKKPAGVFYFKIKEPLVDLSTKDIDKETLQEEIKKSFKLDGIMVDDPQVILDIAGGFEGFSHVVPIRATKEGIKNTGKEGLLPPEEFEKLQQAVAGKVKEACTDLLKGRIQPYPMKTGETSACAYCKYKGICRFDTIFEGCKYNIVGAKRSYD